MAASQLAATVQTIVQGVQTKDDALNTPVFKKQRSRENIAEIVAQLPESIVISFLIYLKEHKPLMYSSFPNHVTWVHNTLLHHYNCIKCLPMSERKALLEPLRNDPSNLAALPKVLEMKARLDHFHRKQELYEQAAKAEADSNMAEGANKPGLIFNWRKESSDDEDDLGAASTVGASESEDNWDELSEVAYGGSEDEDQQHGTSSTSSRGFPAESEIFDVEDDSSSDEMEAEDECQDSSNSLQDSEQENMSDSDDDS